MMIKVGDLVMVVKPVPCGCKSAYKFIGMIGTVISLDTDKGYCGACGAEFGVSEFAEITKGQFVRISRLIKIDPPALQDETTTEKELAL